MNRPLAWAVSISLMLMGLVSVLFASSLTRPATNPMSDAAPLFQANMIQGTLAAAIFFVLAEAAARRWSAPVGGWKAWWLLVSALFLMPGTPLLVSAFEAATPLSRRTVVFRFVMGAIDFVLGMAALSAAAATRFRRR